MSTARTAWALSVFDGFLHAWTPTAMHQRLTDDDSDGARVRAAIQAIAPRDVEDRRLGWAVFSKTPDTDYDRERPSGFVYHLVSAVFENEAQAHNALEYWRDRTASDAAPDFVICEITQASEDHR